MEQKAVTYKTIKGMARDMAMSSGNNDFSYENYNIRITTRGKEDSLVVTNEKGTESNIIATRDVLKTVNNVFVGMQPDFYNDAYTAVNGVNFDNIDKYDYTELYRKVDNEYIPIEKEEFYIDSNSHRHPLVYSVFTISGTTTDEQKDFFNKNKGKLYTISQDDTITQNNIVEKLPLKLDSSIYKLTTAWSGSTTYYKATQLDENAEYDSSVTYYSKTTDNNDNLILYKKAEINSIADLTGENGIIKFALNTEYPTSSDLYAKGSFRIDETPITFENEQYTLLDNGEYLNENLVVAIPENKNYGLQKVCLKNIALGKLDVNTLTDDDGTLGYKQDLNVTSDNFDEIKDELYTYNSETHVYTPVGDASYSSTTYYYRLKSIEEQDWNNSYKKMYDKATNEIFDFIGFNYSSNDINYTDSDKLEALISSINPTQLSLPTGKYKPKENYLSSKLSKKNNVSGNTYNINTTDFGNLEYLANALYCDRYPTQTEIKYRTTSNKYSVIRLPLFYEYYMSDSDQTDNGRTFFYVNRNTNVFYNSKKFIHYFERVYGNISDYNYKLYKNEIRAFELVGFVEFKFSQDLSVFPKKVDGSYGEPYTPISYRFTIGNGGSFEASGSSSLIPYITYNSATAPFKLSISFSDYYDGTGKYVPVATFNVSLANTTANDRIWMYEPSGPFYSSNLNKLNIDDDGGLYTFDNVTGNVDSSVNIRIYNNPVNSSTYTTLSEWSPVAHSSGATPSLTKSMDHPVTAQSIRYGRYVYESEELTYSDQSHTNGYYPVTITGINNVSSYKIKTYANTPTIHIQSIKTNIIDNVSEITLDDNSKINYHVKDNTITLNSSTTKYYLYSITINNHPMPYIIYTTVDLESADNGNYEFKTAKLSSDAFTLVDGFDTINVIPADFTDNIITSISGTRIVKSNSGYEINTTSNISADPYISGTAIATLTRMTTLPILNKQVVDDDYTSIISNNKEILVNPTYDNVLRYFNIDDTQLFLTKNYSSSLTINKFKLKRSNNDWDNKFVYKFLNLEGNNNVEYTKKINPPMSVLDTYKVSLSVSQSGEDVVLKASIDIPDDKYFNSINNYSSIKVTIEDGSDKSFNAVYSLENLKNGITVAGKDASKHNYRITKINTDNIPSDLIKDKNKNEAQFEIDYKEKPITLEILTSGDRTFVRQSIYFGYTFESICEYSFKDNYSNNFFSVISNNILVTNFGDYHALTIPGRILGSCAVDDYVVLFFHYSSPAIDWYWWDRGTYKLLPPNTTLYDGSGKILPQYTNLYTRNKNNRDKYDKAAENGILLTDNNKDYINGRIQDYIVKLKYIDAKPDNKENEWSEIVAKIANVSTQSGLFTEILEKKPYYAADILYQGNLNFSTSNGVEAIGYYESKDVIKVYFTDGRNQPRMLNIMTPEAQRNGDIKKWDSKSFDFIQEISGTEKCKVTKQYGGGAFPSGTVQYYFTYTNLGGCETNPFLCTPIYYSSQQDTGNSVLKITDNTFKIYLYNLSTRFDYVNIYSVVRSSKDLQPICKKVINISLNGKKSFTFTDNNLLGEIVDNAYLLMLQGVPVSALTMAEKDNTLFLGNINKLNKNLTSEDKDNIKKLLNIQIKNRKYIDYDVDNDDWYENRVKNNTISLGESSRDIKTFMFNEWYRFGIQLQDKYGKWSDPIFIDDKQCNLQIQNVLKNTENEDGTNKISNIKTLIPYFYASLSSGDRDTLKEILLKYDFVRIRPVIVYPNISSRNVLCQGLINPTMFNYADRSINAPFSFSSYFFRPIPPAISEEKDESGRNLHDVDLTKPEVCGYPIEYRHGYPISGYHDAIEEELAISGQTNNINSDTIKSLVNNYLSKQKLTTATLTVNTIGWWVNTSVYMRNGELIINDMNSVVYKAGSELYEVKSNTNKGDIIPLKTLDYNLIDNDYGNGQVVGTTTSANKIFGQMLSTFSTRSSHDSYTDCYGFRSHIHYFKNALIQFISISWEDIANTLSGKALNGNELVKSISDTLCILSAEGLVFNEGGTLYKASYPCTLKITPKSDIRLYKHRMLKRKSYYVNINVISDNIIVLTNGNGDKYIDKKGENIDASSKAYFAYTDGEIQCANGNKGYNIYTNGLSSTLEENYGSPEINPEARKQSLFYVDESIVTLNSPEIEYDPTVQKIDLSTYKLNIVGAANITGYAQNINIDAETPPATAGMTVCEGFRHNNIEVQNFNKEAYRYMLSGGYWYDNYFNVGNDDNPEEAAGPAEIILDQYCWWVYPFNRAILNNCKDGGNGKCRTKQWYNYHYSAFNDYFGNSSFTYELKDAKQLYGDFQSITFNNQWDSTKEYLYFGSVDTAYTNPVPLVGLLGGDNSADDNAFEQSLAVSPHCDFKAGSRTYSSSDYADIVPLSFRSTNHFLLSFGNPYGINDYSNYNFLLPDYYTDNYLVEAAKETNTKVIEETTLYKLISFVNNNGNAQQFEENYYIDAEPKCDGTIYSIYVDDVTTGYKQLNQGRIQVSIIGSSSTETSYLLDLIIYISDEAADAKYTAQKEFKVPIGGSAIEYLKILLKYEKTIVNLIETNNVSLNDDNIPLANNIYCTMHDYGEQALEALIPRNNKSKGSVKPLVKFDNGDNIGIYKYGHIYIAQLERGVKNADDVFSGTNESVLLQQTWIPAGDAISINEFINGNQLKWTEGDTFYQRYDCLKTYAYSDMAVNQVIESLSTMIQTRINLDGIYSLRGNIDNLGTNETNTNLLNTAYSQSDNYFTYSITDPYISDITEYSNMFTWSLTKQPMSRTDNWLAINLIAYYNATGSFGKITRLINYRNQLFCFQDNAISQIAYNERVQLTPSDGVPIEIGNNGKVQGLNYISSNVGCQNRWSVCPSKGYLYWVDDRRAEIYRFSEGLEPFSTINGFSDWVKANTYGEDWKPIISTNVPITTYYDNNNDDIYFVTEKDCLAYNEKLNAFESFFSYEDSFILNSAGNTLVIKEQDTLVKQLTDYTDVYDDSDSSWCGNGIRGDGLSSIELMHEGEYNKFFGEYKPYYLRFKVYPTDLQRDKIYTNIEFNTDAFNEKDIYMPTGTFTRVRVWDEYQWGEMYFDNTLYGTTSFKKRFRTYYAQLPRASYYPTGLYEDYEYLYQRQSQWKPIDSDVLANEDLAYHYYWNNNPACVNDRIRNPWVWMELYKNPKDKSNFVEFSFYEGEDIPTKKHYDLTNYKVTFADTTEGIAEFNKAKINLYIIENEVYVRLDENATRQDITYYNLESAYMDIRTKLYYQNYVDIDFDDYGYYEVLYKLVGDVYTKAQPSDRTNKDLKLYRLDYVNCANILTFDVNKTYYELIADNNRMEIHDIILKYFEA